MTPLDQILSNNEGLPPAPHILPQLLTALSDPDSDLGRIVELASLDAAITARVIQLCNSAALVRARPVVDVMEAVNRLGLQEVYQIVAALNGARTLRPRRPNTGLNPETLWRHSVTTALAADLIARDLGQDRTLLFTAGLLHDLGRVILADSLGDSYTKAITPRRNALDNSANPEREALGFDHAEAGGRLLVDWKFSIPMAMAVWHHHNPEAAGLHAPLAYTLNVADLVAHIAYDSDPQALKSCGIELLPPAVRVNFNNFTGYVQETREEFEFVELLCRAGG